MLTRTCRFLIVCLAKKIQQRQSPFRSLFRRHDRLSSYQILGFSPVLVLRKYMHQQLGSAFPFNANRIAGTITCDTVCAVEYS